MENIDFIFQGGTVTIAHYNMYYNMAIEHYNIAKKKYEKAKSKNSKTDYGMIQKEVISSIIFSSLSIEAIIYEYGVERLGLDYYKEHLDKLSVKSKWTVIPRLVTTKEIDQVVINKLNQLIIHRNQVVHHKSKTVPISKYNKQDFQKTLVQAEQGIMCVENVLFELLKIDEWNCGFFFHMFEWAGRDAFFKKYRTEAIKIHTKQKKKRQVKK
jgi:hypothetical protein